ncbi:MAG: hypothetical protein HZA50_15540 [Planctomycetes bacterium]|nr:hypothetical protein [Planctomycetota bacterium]
MTFRAILIGLLGAAFIGGTAYINDMYMRSSLMVGHNFPLSVFGGLVAATMLLNPLLGLVRRGWMFSSGELAIMMAVMLAGCGLATGGMMRFFTTDLVMPVKFYQNDISWKKAEVMKYLPPGVIPGDGKYDKEIVEDFLTGKVREAEPVEKPGPPLPWYRSLYEWFLKVADRFRNDVPWAKWGPALSNWVPLSLLVFMCSVCLALIVHRQWSSNEHLRYPIARIANILMDQDEGRRFGPIYRNGLFWTGFGIIFGINLINGINAWYPNEFIQVPLRFDFGALRQKWPDMGTVPHAHVIFFWPFLFPAVVAITFFLASDVSLSLGLSGIIYSIVIYTLWHMNIGAFGDQVLGDNMFICWQQFGSAIAILLLMLYTGRRYYTQVFKGAFTGRHARDVEKTSVWALRILLICMAGLVLVLGRMGLDWPLAVALMLLIGFKFIIVARINVESGMFFAQTTWNSLFIMISVFGCQALGPSALLVIGIISVTLALDTRELILPFILNGLKLCDNRRIPAGKAAWPMAGAIVLALAVAIPAVLWANYNFGKPKYDGWSTEAMPKTAFDIASKAISKLQMDGKLQESLGYSAWQRVTHAEVINRFGSAVLIGFVLALAVSILRLRFAWWPIHPVIFLMWGNWGISLVAFSFLIGWILKTLVTRLGGSQNLQRAQALMIGVIAGDLLAGLLFMGFGGGYYLFMDKFPPQFSILPR